MRKMSLELERVLSFKDGLSEYPHLCKPFGSPTPLVFQALLYDLLNQGWSAHFDPCTNILDRVVKPCYGAKNASESWNCTSDVTTGIIETTLVPSVTLHNLTEQQHLFNHELLRVLNRFGLFLWYFETPLGFVPSREYYNFFHTYWRGAYSFRRMRGEDHYWFSWTIGNSPCLDVSVDEAIPFLRIIHRITGATFFFRRLGSISGDQISLENRMSIRPWAYSNLWKFSPYPSDMTRTLMIPHQEFTCWKDYFSYMMNLRICSLINRDLRPNRVVGDPSFADFWLQPSQKGWSICTFAGQLINSAMANIVNLENLQRQVFFPDYGGRFQTMLI